MQALWQKKESDPSEIHKHKAKPIKIKELLAHHANP
jgi:hypothetical protein